MAKIAAAVLPVLLVAGPVVAASPADFINYYYDRNTNGLIDGSDLGGKLFIPANYDPTKKYAVVTFLHGAGETGSAGGWGSQINSNIDNLLAAAKANGFILYAPQVHQSWNTDGRTLVANVLAKITREYSVDTSKLYVTGLSLGGGGTINLAAQYNYVFAAAIDICGVSVSASSSRLVNMPIWIHHANNDGTVNVSASRNRVNSIRNAKGLPNLTFGSNGMNYDDGILRYTEHTGGDHWIWGSVYEKPELYSWLLSKSTTIPTLQLGQTVKFDLGNSQRTTAFNGETWNSTAQNMHDTLAPAISFALTTTGVGTQVGLDVTDRFAAATSNSTSNVLGDSWQATVSNPGELELFGLTPGNYYNLALFGSSTTAGSTRYIVNGLVQDFVHTNNSDSILFNYIQADDTGAIAIHVPYGFINTISVTAVPEPSMATLVLPLAGWMVSRRKRRVSCEIADGEGNGQ
jgi:pimeloyl-ACP methyl ester carboxylesterase